MNGHHFDSEGRCRRCEVAAHQAWRYPCLDRKGDEQLVLFNAPSQR